MYQVIFSKNADKQLAKLDKGEARIIMAWIRKNLCDCEDPRALGKALKGNYSNVWRYRVGNYRIMAELHDDKLIILVINIGHRKDIYEWKK